LYRLPSGESSKNMLIPPKWLQSVEVLDGTVDMRGIGIAAAGSAYRSWLASSSRRRCRQRARVGPMLPTGMSSAAATSA